MSAKTVRRMASAIMKVGESRIWIDPSRMEDVESAITREDVRRLISEGAILKRQQQTPSRGRLRLRKAERRLGRHRGGGSRKGTRESRYPSKREWITKVRAQRTFLAELRANRKIKPSVYRTLYRQVKGGQFQGIRALQSAVASQEGRGEAHR
jgi:large subunit ribosomal protein L19e